LQGVITKHDEIVSPATETSRADLSKLAIPMGQRKPQLESDLGRYVALYLAVGGSTSRWFYRLSGRQLDGRVLNPGKVSRLEYSTLHRRRLSMKGRGLRLMTKPPESHRYADYA
jgi:hypothetical protein